MPLSYVPATREDADVIFSMCKQLIDSYEDVETIDYEKVIAWVRKKIDDNIGKYTCVTQNGEKVGYFSLQPGREEAELDDLYVLPEYRGKGIGTEVLSYCISRVKTPVFLYVFRKNTGAIKLYERMGFSVAEEVGTTRLIMRR